MVQFFRQTFRLEKGVKPKVYVETTIPSYLAAPLSNDLRVAANQSITIEWWQTRRPSFDLYISEFVAVAAVNGIDYLLTWNCTHLANAVMRPKIEEVCRKQGFEPPIICTPQELMEG
jgi:hypothetical protein